MPLAKAFAAPACGWFHELRYRERKRTRAAERNSIAEVKEFRAKHPRKRRAIKISSETAKYCSAPEARLNARAGTSSVNCASLGVSSFAHSGRKFLEAGRWDLSERLRCVVVTFLIATALGSVDFAQNPVRKGRPLQGARNREIVRDAITYRHVIRPSSCTIILRRMPAGALRGRVGYLQRDCYVHLYCIPRQTRAGIPEAQLWSKAY